MNLRNNTIDFAKFIAAFLVVAIHTSLFSDVNQTLYFVFNELVCRLAVPFFAICTGYYLCLSVNNGQFNKVWKQEWKLIKIYALWTFLYFLFLIISAIPKITLLSALSEVLTLRPVPLATF